VVELRKMRSSAPISSKCGRTSDRSKSRLLKPGGLATCWSSGADGEDEADRSVKLMIVSARSMVDTMSDLFIAAG